MCCKDLLSAAIAAASKAEASGFNETAAAFRELAKSMDSKETDGPLPISISPAIE